MLRIDCLCAINGIRWKIAFTLFVFHTSLDVITLFASMLMDIMIRYTTFVESVSTVTSINMKIFEYVYGLFFIIMLRSSLKYGFLYILYCIIFKSFSKKLPNPNFNKTFHRNPRLLCLATASFEIMSTVIIVLSRETRS